MIYVHQWHSHVPNNNEKIYLCMCKNLLEEEISALIYIQSILDLGLEMSANYKFFPIKTKTADSDRMLNVQWPETNCEYYLNIKHTGRSSDRKIHLTVLLPWLEKYRKYVV